MNTRRRAFTLVELMVTIALIAILAGLVIVSLGSQRRAARDANRQLALGEYSTALQQYFSQNRTYMLAPSPCTIGNSSLMYPGMAQGQSFPMPIDNTNKPPADSGCVGFHGGGWGSMNRHFSALIPDYGANSIADALRLAGFLQRVSTDPRTGGDFPTQPTSFFKSGNGATVSDFDDFILTLCTLDGKPATKPEEATEFGIFAQFERDPVIVNAHATKSTQECGGPQTPYGWDTIQ